MAESWIDVGAAGDLSKTSLQPITVGKSPVALSYKDGVFGAVSNICNHVGGPLGEGRLDGDFIVCHWHGWKFDRKTGVGEPGYEEDRVPSFPVKVEGGRVRLVLLRGLGHAVLSADYDPAALRAVLEAEVA